MNERSADGFESVDVEAAYGQWLRGFAAAMSSRDADQVVSLFEADGYWKDILSFTWCYRTFGGSEDIGRALRATLDQAGARDFRPASGRTPPRLVRRAQRSVIEAYFDFDTNVGTGTGFVRLVEDVTAPGALRVWILLTTLQELRGFEEQTGSRRPTGLEYSHSFAGDNWLDKRRREQAFEHDRADVLIVGAGQGGLSLGARLQQMGVSTLLVERNARVGDNWRHRYHSLTLHNEVWSNHLPYLPFPSTWPAFVPKDQLAGWLEGYAEFMELNVWTSTEFLDAAFDDEDRAWVVRVRRAGGEVREMRVSHLVLANGGASGEPKLPELPGLSTFGGPVMHSSEFRGAAEWAGRRCLVVGSGTSGHDVAQELASNGADVTMMQHGPTCVVSLQPSGTLVYAVYSEGPPADDVDLVTAAIPFPVLQSSYRFLTQKTCELDRDLLQGLRSRGFRTDEGPDSTGFHMMYLRRGGGYYINVGCSEMIVSGQIALLQAEEYESFTPRGLRKRAGDDVPLDLVVLATGYHDQQEAIRRMLGAEVAEKVGPVWGFDDNYIMRNMWQRTAQEGLWLMGGSLLDCRLYTRFLALLIKADLEGLSRPEVGLPSTYYDATGRSTR